ncbi:MAG: hypothetical protein NCW75_06440 [Phycisphaera sp.]|nr:MAG: hypothetical protein NCW75_06440 [Phycisphaera sp.]
MPPGTPTPTPTPTVAAPLPCVGCGYDLVGLAEDGPCPECGVPIGRSISGDHLVASSKAHRRKLASGAGFALTGVWAGWVSVALLPVYALLVQSLGPDLAIMTVGGPVALVVSLSLLASGQGWLRLTAADPDRIGDGTGRWMQRFVLRLYAWGLGYLGPIMALLWFALDGLARTRGTPPPGPPVPILLTALACLPMLALSGPIAAEFSKLGRRLLEGDLADRSRGLTATGWVAFGLVIVAVQFGWFTLQGWWWLLEPIAWTLAGIAVLAWAVQYHTLVRALRAALIPVAARP